MPASLHASQCELQKQACSAVSLDFDRIERCTITSPFIHCLESVAPLSSVTGDTVCILIYSFSMSLSVHCPLVFVTWNLPECSEVLGSPF